MTRTYKFEITGSAANGQTWTADGHVMDEHNDLLATFGAAMREAFGQLTKGKAVYGKPGVGCSGPYQIKRVVLEQTPASGGS